MRPGRRAVAVGHQARIAAAMLRDEYARPLPRATDGPLVTVVMAAYNRAEVLRYALASAIGQSYRNTEVLVIGDACTDESEAVVAATAAGDERVRWTNLATNTGSQVGPNQAGLEAARGELIAYLGQDDLWRRDHLALLVADLDRSGAGATSTVTSQIWPRPVPTRRLLSPAPGEFIPTSSMMHTRAAGLAAGGWRDHRKTVRPPDLDFQTRLAESGSTFSRVRALGVVKFASAQRPGSYRDPGAREQAAAARRIDRHSFVAREVAAAAALAPLRRWFGSPPPIDPVKAATPGGVIAEFRRIRGLDPGGEAR